MSDRPTPETDEQPWINAINEDGYQVPCVDIEFARRLERERDELQKKLKLAEKSFLAIDSLNASYVAAWKEVTDALGEREAGDSTSDVDRVLNAIRKK